MTRDDYREKLGRLLQSSTTPGCELIVTVNNESTTRFANNLIHQNVSSDDLGLSVRVTDGYRTGHGRTNQLDGDGPLKMLALATERMKFQPKSEREIRLIGPQSYRRLDNFDEQTASLTASDRAHLAGQIISQVNRYGLMAAGTVVNGDHTIMVVNSNGVEACHRFSHFMITLTVYDTSGASAWMSEEGTAFTSGHYLPLVIRTIERTLQGRNQQTINPGPWTVILEPPAVATFVEYLGWLAFNAKDYQLQRSCLSGRLGERVTGDAVTIVDDAYNPRVLGIPFDGEGAAKQKVLLIDQGVARNIVHDSMTARDMNTVTTGHSLSQPNDIGPIPMHLVMGHGSESAESLIASTERGVLVTRFHYNRVVDEKKALLTGMTRDGTFFIKDGAIAFPIRNMRYNESILGAFQRIEGVSTYQSLQGEYGKVLVPAVKIKDFRFTDIVQS